MEDIEISVYCLAYNCVEFIEKSINGMLNQKINVNYKIIIHDDASTDGTANIIKKYTEMYPEKIFSILQTENQYSKGIDIYRQYIYPNIEGKYIALCEGDDYWIDENKLQIQYNYMEQHKECSLCTHNTLIYNLTTNKINKFNIWTKEHILTAEEVFMGWLVHTSSYFLRRKYMDWSGNNYWFGDYMMLTWAFYRGQVVSLPQVMSQYNSQNPKGITFMNDHQVISKRITTWKQVVEYLKEYNILTQYRYEQYTQKRIERIRFQCIEKECDNIILHSHSKEDSISATKRIVSHEYYVTYVNMKRGLRRLIRRYKYEGYIFYPLWKYIMKKYLKNRL